MTTLVHTSPEGPAGQQISLLTATTRARSLVQTLDSSLVDNASLVAGATVTAALDNLVATIGALNSNQVLNASTVAGVSVSDALNALAARQPITIILTIAVPFLGNNVTGYVDTTLVGTGLQGMQAGDQVLVTPRQDVVAAGLNQGMFCNARISALNTLRTLFRGATVVGNQDFTVTAIR